MCGSSHLKLLLWALIIPTSMVASAAADTLRWGDGAGGGAAGSFEVTYEKRLFEPGEEEGYCKRCANYLEIRAELDEADRLDGSHADVTAFAVGYRRYFFPFMVKDPQRKADHWRRDTSAVFAGAGMAAYEVDEPSGRSSMTSAGWYARAGLLVPLTHACRINDKGVREYRGVYLDGTLSYTYHEIATPGVNLDYDSVRVGLRLNFPSSRDKARARFLLRQWEEAQDGDQMPEGVVDPCPGR